MMKRITCAAAFYYGFMALLCMAIFVMSIVAYFTLVDAYKASAADHPLCSYFAELAKEPDVQVAEWVGYPRGWKNMPLAWDYETFTPLAGDSGILTQVKGSDRWLWGFRTLELGTDSNGDWEGMHDFCDHVLIISP